MIRLIHKHHATETPLGGLSEEKMEARIRRKTPQGAVPSKGE